MKFLKGWAIKEDRDETTWWMIRGGAFSNVINKKYPKRIFGSREDAELSSNKLNRESRRNTKVQELSNARNRFTKISRSESEGAGSSSDAPNDSSS
jgi:hypothetical protein|tara:strand:+ start:4645 stop:4932 length:288 start_codon:yes stop_codon:yes gene_type:complete